MTDGLQGKHYMQPGVSQDLGHTFAATPWRVMKGPLRESLPGLGLVQGRPLQAFTP